MRAAALTGYDEISLIELPDPTVTAATDVIVRVAGAGVCGSDVHLASGVLADVMGDLDFPFVLGHENAGWVEAVGAGVTTLAVGDPVLLHPHISCGLCRACRRGEETFCAALRFPGVDGTPGGYAEYVKSDVRAVVRLPDGTDPAPLSPIADAGLTAYHAVRKTVGHLPPDGTAVVTGVGGVGYFALQLLRTFSPAQLVAIDTEPARLQAAGGLGADATVVGGEGAVEAVLELTDGRGADLVVDCVGVRDTAASALKMLGRGGQLSVVGAAAGHEVCCGTVPMTIGEVAIEGSLVGTVGELAELAEMTLRGRVRLIQSYYSLADAGAALQDLAAGRVDGRAVLRP